MTCKDWFVKALKPGFEPGFKPARGDPIGFQVLRLNHSAITACYINCQALTSRLSHSVNFTSVKTRLSTEEPI